MDYEKLYALYQQLLRDAMIADEDAGTAQRDGKLDRAAQLYDQAAALYAKAAQALMDTEEGADAQESAEISKSVDRLISIVKELRSLAAQLAAESQSVAGSSGSTGSSGASGAPKGASKPESKLPSEEDDVQFVPVANVPDVTFDDIAGLDAAKQLVLEEIIHPLIYSDLYERFHIEDNGGLLLFGPPGSGKTMLARAIANRAGLPFFSVRCSDIVGKYFGEAEKHVRALFNAARNAHDAVIFMDEAEALACRRGGKSTVMNRLVPELLSQMDGFDRFDGHLIVIFATNRPYDIDPAFLRPGRLPHHCYVPLPEPPVRRAFLDKLLRQRPVEPGIDVEHLVQATDRFSCADLANLVKKGSLCPVNRIIKCRESGAPEQEELLTRRDIDEALQKLHPSVEPAEIARIEKWMGQVGFHLPAAS